VQDRRARFEARVGLWSRESGPRIFPGRVDGRIGHETRGKGGFGFDPIFIPDGEVRTFAEIGTVEKNAFSHRGRAVAALLDFLDGPGKRARGGAIST